MCSLFDQYTLWSKAEATGCKITTVFKGLRYGEMERDAGIVQGTARFVKERLFDMSDEWRVEVCDRCGYMTQKVGHCVQCDTDEVTTVNLPWSGGQLMKILHGMAIKTEISTK